MNYDQFEPISQEGYYSTGMPSRKRRHMGLLMVLSVVLVVCCAALAVASLYEVRIERSADRMSLTLVDRDPTVTASAPEISDDLPLSRSEASVSSMQLLPSNTGQTVPLTVIYENCIASVVSVIASTRESSQTCCGIVMTSDGYIITSAAATARSSAITVLLHNGEEYIAALVGADPVSDLAVLKIDAEELSPADFSDGTNLNVGETVAAIGDPSGLELRGTMTDGILSSLNPDLNLEGRTLTVLQSSAVLPEGGYGGPLINMRGQVIGINVQRLGALSSDATPSLGLAVATNSAKGIVDELIETGYLPGYPSLVISPQNVPAAAQRYYHLPNGVYIDTVRPDSAADLGGLLPGDIITAIDGHAVTSLDELTLVINRYKPGDLVLVTLYRSGTQLDLPILLEEAS